ncbi:MAG: hypothetical protein SFT92_03650 [Rickettsiales bacterium]|nr:hypothetical protein [Rickettsiales bacterium]
MTSSKKRIEMWLLAALPGLITLLLLALYVMPKHITGLSGVMPLLPLLPIYHWGMQQRDMPYWFVFIVGLVLDALAGHWMGFMALSLLMFLVVVRTQRKYIHKEGFVIKWGYFALLLFGMLFLHWLVTSIAHDRVEHILPPLVQWLLTVMLYPPLYTLFDRLQEYSGRKRWRYIHGL